MEFGAFEILIGTSVLLFSLYYYFSQNFDYWKKRGVIGPKPILFFGNYKGVILGQTHESVVVENFYENYKTERFIGVFVQNNPRLLIQDPDLIKDVLIKDFSAFPDRGYEVQGNVNPFSANLVNLEYERWKPLRHSLSPIFTSGKLKKMFYLIVECAHNFQKYTEQLIKKDELIECREFTTKFTMDSFVVCAFGLNAMNDEDNEFQKLGKSMYDLSFRNRVKTTLRLFFPTIYNLIGHLLEKKSSNQFFMSAIKQAMEYRRKNNIRRNHFLDLLMDLKEQSDKTSGVEFTDKLLIAQAWVFFAGGFETSSATISNTLYELALNPSIQDRLRQEILEELDKNDGKLTNECIRSMSYLDMVLKETLRKYPVVGILKDMKVMIPVRAIHRDPEIYPDPLRFDPERFNNENEKMRHSMHYLPFGDGPHNCIGLRFAKYQTKVGCSDHRKISTECM